MKRNIKTLKDNELIRTYVYEYNEIEHKEYNKTLAEHIRNIERELISRGILKESDIEYLNR